MRSFQSSFSDKLAEIVETILNAYLPVSMQPPLCYRSMGSLYVPGKLPTYPSPKPTFCPKSEVTKVLMLA